MLFEAHNISKRFAGTQALRDVSFQVQSGEILGLIGPNGAGKSTLFECLAGTIPADSGEILRQGASVPANQRSTLLFYVPDNIAPWPHETVRWALDFVIGFLAGQSHLRSTLIDQLDLTALLPQRIAALSKGQRKRVLLAIGLLTSQPALLIDEPFEGLDLRQARQIAKVLRTYTALGRTLFLSHPPNQRSSETL